MELQTFHYDNNIVRKFALATLIWGLVGMVVGLLIAAQLVFPSLNFAEYFTFGRLRPLHTNAVIFAFVGNGTFTGVYYSLQRLCKARMYNDILSSINFWGWQLIIVAAALTLPLGYTTGKEYAELEWPIDIAIALIWVVFGINMLGTIIKRRVKHLYVAIWFYIATFVAVAILHIVNSMEMPVSFLKSYSAYAGVQDALVQWWYGHNAVAFFLTTSYLGLMYYFVPKAAQRPVYSYRLSIIHFWGLIFIYIWAGPHHLLFTALPDWVQSIGVVFSIMLIAPSWGGMLNGLLTLRGAWDRVREDPILKFMVVAITCYGMATFEGPMMSLKNVNAISHYSDWTIAHVHIGGLGWNGFLTFGMLYWLFPKIYGTQLFSKKMANYHFWLGTIGIIFYAIPLYWAGFTQSLMWKEFNPDGMLTHQNFLTTVTQLMPMYALRVLGGLLYISGVVLMLYNIIKTISGAGKFVKNQEAQAPPMTIGAGNSGEGYWHKVIESKPIQIMIMSAVLILVGTAAELVPVFLVKSNVPTITSVQPYTPLELEGRDLYLKEGCYNCHSQMIRPFRSETARYGEYSKAGEFVYDHPFQWGSKRTGPDLAREGVKTLRNYKSNSWHYEHMINPQKLSPGSIMPAYPHLATNKLNSSQLQQKIKAMQKLGVPYPKGYHKNAERDLEKQAAEIAETIDGAVADSEIIALVAYLQRLGTDIYRTEPLIFEGVDEEIEEEVAPSDK
ncbi:MAG: cytochrome-c oxidase, cbb3-type subunit I [Aureispira sp.]|nr:cytochrome-c oxidase, cbb3-type subunit I [Aureispira sp.]